MKSSEVDLLVANLTHTFLRYAGKALACQPLNDWTKTDEETADRTAMRCPEFEMIHKSVFLDDKFAILINPQQGYWRLDKHKSTYLSELYGILKELISQHNVPEKVLIDFRRRPQNPTMDIYFELADEDDIVLLADILNQAVIECQKRIIAESAIVHHKSYKRFIEDILERATEDGVDIDLAYATAVFAKAHKSITKKNYSVSKNERDAFQKNAKLTLPETTIYAKSFDFRDYLGEKPIYLEP